MYVGGFWQFSVYLFYSIDIRKKTIYNNHIRYIYLLINYLLYKITLKNKYKNFLDINNSFCMQ